MGSSQTPSGGGGTGATVTLDTTNFDNNLSASDSDVQTAMETIDDLVITGDMLAATYDPTAVAGDAFDMDNMVEGATNLILTDVERTAIASALTNPMTAEGDIIYGDTDGVPAVLAKGTDGQVLKLASGVPSWADESGGGATLWTAWTGASRTDDNTISTSQASEDLPVGTAIRYKATAGAYEYGVVLSRTDRAHTILGHPVTTDDDDVFEYDASHLKVHSETIHLAGNFNAADSNSFLTSYDLMQLGWMPAIADEYYLVGMFTVCDDADSSLDPRVNAVIQGGTNKIFTADTDVDEAEKNTGATVDATNRYYALGLKSRIDILIDKDYDPGEGAETGAGDAYDADITFIFVKA
jgi:hypothetical protein